MLAQGLLELLLLLCDWGYFSQRYWICNEYDCVFVDAGVYVFCAFTIVYSKARADICVIKP